MTSKEKISAWINSHNYIMLRAVADSIFLNERRGEGNLSQALDWILTCFRLDTKYKALMKFLDHLNKYQRGSRAAEDIEALKQLQTFLKNVEHLTEK